MDFLVVCTTNRIDEIAPIIEAEDIQGVVRNGFATYEAVNHGVPVTVEDYRDSLRETIHDPVGYDSWTYTIISIPTGTKEVEVVDIEELLENDGFWDNL